jgi:hypothetical protein
MSGKGTSTAGNSGGAQPFCTLRSCTNFSVSKYLKQLRQVLPWVPPVPIGALKSLHSARDYKGMVRLIKKTMNVEIDLRIVWVSEGDAKIGSVKDAPAWVDLPGKMPAYGSDAFRKSRLDIYLRRSFLERSAYDQVTAAIAHELSHIILDSIEHPLRRCEKAVDLTAMLFGFSQVYASGTHTVQQEYNRIVTHELGYLSAEEVMLADQILTGDKAKPRAGTSFLDRPDVRKALGTAAALLVLLGLATILPQTLKPQNQSTRPAQLVRHDYSSLSRDAKQFELRKPDSDTVIRGSMKDNGAGPNGSDESWANPTKCCGLW